MKKIIYIFLSLFVFLFILTPKAFAQMPRQLLNTPREQIGNSAGQMVFKSGEVVEIDKEVDGDLHVAAGEVGVFERIKGDLLVLGGKVVVDGQVDQDLRVLGGEVVVRGKIGRNATILGGNVSIEQTAQIAGSLFVTGGEVVVDPNAKVVGQKTIRRAPQNGLARKQIGQKISRFLKGVSALALAMKWVSVLIFGFLFIKLFPKTLKRLITETEKDFSRKLVKGTILAIVGPVIALFAIFTIIGAPIGFLAIGILAIGWYAAKLISMVFAGYFLLEKAASKKFLFWPKKQNLYAAFLTGVLVFITLGFIPFFGWMVKLLLILACFGALYQEKLAVYKKVEK